MNKIILFVFTLFVFTNNSSAKTIILKKDYIGTFGATYKIAEKDAIAELKQKAAQTDWKKYFNPEKIKALVKNYSPDLIKLPRAGKNNSFLVDMTYTLEFDIPDGKGGILYPAGFKFNPLEYMNFSKILVIFDGADIEQVQWCQNSYADDYKSTLLITGGSCYKLSGLFKRPVFYASADFIRRFGVRAVPSVISQQKNYMEIKEIEIKNNNTDSDSVDIKQP